METLPDSLSSCLYEHAPFFYLAFDPDGLIRKTNRYTLELLGPDVLGKSFKDVFVNFPATPDLAALARDPNRRERWDVCALNQLPQSIQCGFHAVGELFLAIGFVDISEMQLLQHQFITLNNDLNSVTRELQKTNAQLQKLNELKNRFVGFAAHDLRNPIGVIQTYTEFLQEEARENLSAEHNEFLDIIHDRAKAMTQMITDLLDIAMIESGRNEATLQNTALALIFRTACLSVKGAADAKKVQIVSTLDPSLPTLPLDRGKIEQTTVNLLRNAVEHTGNGTTVRLSARRDGGNVVVSIQDQGSGISEAMLDKLFQPFARGQARKSGGQDSHGLGLALAKRMIDAHHGRIWAESKPNEGATFLFTLPIASNAEILEGKLT